MTMPPPRALHTRLFGRNACAKLSPTGSYAKPIRLDSSASNHAKLTWSVQVRRRRRAGKGVAGLALRRSGACDAGAAPGIENAVEAEDNRQVVGSDENAEC